MNKVMRLLQTQAEFAVTRPRTMRFSVPDMVNPQERRQSKLVNSSLFNGPDIVTRLLSVKEVIDTKFIGAKNELLKIKQSINDRQNKSRIDKGRKLTVA